MSGRTLVDQRFRPLGVAVVVLVAIVAAVAIAARVRDMPPPRGGVVTVTQALSGPALVGKRIQVTGAVAPVSWNGSRDGTTDLLTFSIAEDRKGSPAGRLRVTWDGPVSPSFGYRSAVIVTGTLGSDRTLKADSVLTRAPMGYRAP
jgi:cytochrome c-type biogenesis protein CcmE